jgi:hypothetical protein
MEWKDWPGWLKGGVITILIYLVILIFTTIIYLHLNNDAEQKDYASFVFVIPFLPALALFSTSTFGTESKIILWLIFTFISLFLWFILGGIFGLLQIRKKKDSEDSVQEIKAPDEEMIKKLEEQSKKSNP